MECPLNQSPISPVGSTTSTNEHALPVSRPNSTGVHCLVNNVSNGLMIARSLRALASYSILDIEAVVGNKDASRIFAAAWEEVIERGQNRRLSIISSKMDEPSPKDNNNNNVYNNDSHHCSPTLVAKTNVKSWLNSEESLSMSELVKESVVSNIRPSTPILNLSISNTSTKNVETNQEAKLSSFLNRKSKTKDNRPHDEDMAKLLRRKAYDEMLRRKRIEKKIKRGKQAEEAKQHNAVQRLLMVQQQLERRHAMLVGVEHQF